jgi:hypothetical protein
MLKILLRSLVLSTLLAVLGLAAPPVYAADCAWSVITGAERSTYAIGAANCTFSVATATSSAGMSLVGVGAFSVTVCAASGQTISTSFALSAYTYGPYEAFWSKASAYDLPAPSAGTGDKCQFIGGFEVDAPAGRVAFAPSAGAVSSGNITIWITAVQRGTYDRRELL